MPEVIIINHDTPIKRFNQWICLLVGLWRSLWYWADVDGCDYTQTEIDIPALVTVNRCEVCGDVEVIWKPLPSDWEAQTQKEKP